MREETVNEIVIEKSRFICYMKKAESEQEYRGYLAAVRKKHHDASHVCSAFICGNIRRSSDDGEPSGTAGAPILSVLDKAGLDRTCALVVRYFGGVKLGAGGLIRAYSRAVGDCLKQAIKVEDHVYPRYELSVSYELGNRMASWMRGNTLLLDIRYGEDMTFVFALEDPARLEKIMEFTRGTVPTQTGVETVQKVVE